MEKIEGLFESRFLHLSGKLVVGVSLGVGNKAHYMGMWRKTSAQTKGAVESEGQILRRRGRGGSNTYFMSRKINILQ